MKIWISAMATVLLMACKPELLGPDLRVTSVPLIDLGAAQQCRQRHQLSIRNAGDQSAYAVVLIQTGDGAEPIRQLRIQPGPAAGEQVNALVCWPADSHPPWCVEARLQRFSETEAADLDPSDNRWCAPFDLPDDNQRETT